MRAYILRRLLLLIPTVFLVSVAVFLIMRLIPGDIVDRMVGQMDYATHGDRAALRTALGLDEPLLTQYGRWIGNILMHGDLGKSLWSRLPVTDEIRARWPVTFELGFLALIVSQLIALPIGVYSALRQDVWADYAARTFAIICIAVPDFWLSTMIIVFPAIWWGHSPPLMLIPFTADPIGNLGMFLVPAVALGMGMSGLTMRMTRTMMLEVLRQDYIRTAWAKGLRERAVVARHALKNALIPVITLVGLQLPIMIGGTVAIEQIFSLPGMGRLIIESTQKRDYTMVSGVLFVYAIALVLINLIVDVAYSVLDPRVSHK